MKALYQDELIAESTATIAIEKNFYFPVESVNMNLLKKNSEKGACEQEGDACYYDLVFNGTIVKDAASSFSRQDQGAEQISNYIVFGESIKVIE